MTGRSILHPHSWAWQPGVTQLLLYEALDGRRGRIRVQCARAFLARLRGLVGRCTPAPGEGVWLEPCSAVHTYGVRGALDVVFVSNRMVVQRVDAAVPRHSVRFGPRSHAVLELRAGEAQRIGLRAGARLAWQDPRAPAASLAASCPPSAQRQWSAFSRRTHLPAMRSAMALALATAAAAMSGARAAPAEPLPSTVAPGQFDDRLDAFDPPAAVTAEPRGRGERDSISALLDEGEAAYRARRVDEAMVAFERVVALDPHHAQAWLRVGNLHQQRRDWFKAIAAYRRVAARSSGDGIDPALRAKALHNRAMVNLELAQQAIRSLERIGPTAAAPSSQPLSATVAAARRRLEALGVPAEPPRPAGPAPAPSAASRTPISRGRPDADPPRVDYIRGAPRQ